MAISPQRGTLTRAVSLITGTAVAFTALIGAAPAHAAYQDIAPSNSYVDDAWRQEVLDQINLERSKVGAPPVKYSETITKFAQPESVRVVVREDSAMSREVALDSRAGNPWDKHTAVGFSTDYDPVDAVNSLKGTPAGETLFRGGSLDVVGIGVTPVDGSLTGSRAGWRLVTVITALGYVEDNGDLPPADTADRVPQRIQPGGVPPQLTSPVNPDDPTAPPGPAPVPPGNYEPTAPTTPAPGTFLTPFRDVPSTHVFVQEITWVQKQKILNGWSDGTFRPNQNIKRDQMAAVAYRLAGSPAVSAPLTSPFRDVPTGHPFYKEIVWAKTNGVLNGWSDGTFRPSADIERGATAALFYRLAGKPAYTAPAKSAFKDVKPGAAFYKEIHWMKTQGISNGWSDATFRPSTTTHRDQMAAFLYRFDKKF